MTPKSLNCWRLLIVLLVVGTAEVYSDQVPEKRGPEQGRSKFSCEGRQSGFYADVSSGCQLYHMCDEGGRAFTHTCPERTRFQQRTMVCDHWYMVECDGVEVAAPSPPSRPAAAPATASATAAAQAQGGPPARKRHSQRVFAHFPYRRGNETVATSTTIQSSETLGRFKISSIPSSTQRTAIASTATIERVPRPSFFSEIPKQNVDNTEEQDAPKFGVSGPIATRAKVERVSKESVSAFPSFSPSFVPSPSFREAKVGNFFTSTKQPSTERAQSPIGNEFNNNPFLESYFRTSLKSSPTTSTTLSYQTTTQGVTQQEDEDDAENKLEIVVPDLRKMFYIPETNFHSSESLSIDGTVLVIELPPKNSTKFQTVEVTEAKNHDCPHCHPSYIISGTCEPCVLIQ